MSLRVVQSASNSASNTNTVAATLNGVLNGNTIIAICPGWESSGDGAPTSVTATGATFVTDATGSFASGVATQVRRAAGVQAGNYTVTATYDAGSYPSIILLEVEGIGDVTPVDVSAAGGASNNSPAAGPTGTTTFAKELIIAAAGASSPSTNPAGWSTPSGYTNTNVQQDLASVTGYSVDYKTVTSTGTQSASWGTLNGAAGDNSWSAVVVAYKDESAGPTRFWLRNTSDNPLAATQFDLYEASGTSNATSVTNTTAGGTEIQTTQTGGGSLVEWVTEPLTAAVTIAGSITFNIQAREAATGNNAGLRAKVFKRASGGTETQIGGSFDFATELGTTNAARNWSGTPGSGVSLAIGDRLLLRLFVRNVGTMGAGSPGVTIQYNNTSASDSYIQFTEGVVITSQSTDANVNITGVSATSAVGTVIPTVEKTPTGVAGNSAVGTVVPTIAKGVTGVAGTTAVGSVFTQPVLIWDTHDWTEAVWSIPPTDRNQTVSGTVGTGQIGTAVPTIEKAVTGVAGTGAVGTVGFSVGAQPSGVAGTGEAGTPSVTVAKTLTGVAGSGAAGTPTPTVAKTPTGVEGTGQVGTLGLSISSSVTLTGVGAAGQVGSVTPEVAKALTGVQATGAVGTPTVSISASTSVNLTGVEGIGAVGTPAPTVSVTLTGVQGAGQVGTAVPTVAATPDGASATGAVGTLTPVVSVTLTGVQATGTAGNVSVNASGNVTTNLTGVAATGAVGTLTVVAQSNATVNLTGVEATGQAGTLTVTTETVVAPVVSGGGGGGPLRFSPTGRDDREALRRQARTIRDMLERVYDKRPLTEEEVATVEAAEEVAQEATEAAAEAPAELPAAPEYGPLIVRLEALLGALAALITRLQQDAEEDDILALLLAS